MYTATIRFNENVKALIFKEKFYILQPALDTELKWIQKKGTIIKVTDNSEGENNTQQ